MKPLTRTLCLTTLLLGSFSQHAAAGPILWYNGDFNGRSAVVNVLAPPTVQQRVFDDFIIPDAPGWTIDAIFSNNLMNQTGVAQADWSIHSGVSEGNGGTVLFSGVSPVTPLATGRAGMGFDEFTIEVGGLNIVLPMGTYWLQVTPIAQGNSDISATDGLNAIGMPPGNNGNSFVDGPGVGNSFRPGSDFVPPPADFSMGVRGVITAVPESSSFNYLLFGLGLLGIGMWLRRKK